MPVAGGLLLLGLMASAHHASVVRYPDQLDIYSVVSDVVAKPLQLPFLFPGRCLAAKALVSRFELLLQQKQRIAQGIAGHGDVEIGCGGDENPVSQRRYGNRNRLHERMTRQLVDDQVDAVALPGWRRARLGLRRFAANISCWCGGSGISLRRLARCALFARRRAAFCRRPGRGYAR